LAVVGRSRFPPFNYGKVNQPSHGVALRQHPLNIESCVPGLNEQVDVLAAAERF